MIGRFSRLGAFQGFLRFREFAQCLAGGGLALAAFLLERTTGPGPVVLGLGLGAVVVNGAPIVVGAVKGLLARHVNVDELVSLAIVASLLQGQILAAAAISFIMHQVDAGLEVFVIGTIQEDGTVTGGTGWGAEFAKICNKPLYVFSQDKAAWFTWQHDAWTTIAPPVVTQAHFTGTGTRFPTDAGRQAIADLFTRSFG